MAASIRSSSPADFAPTARASGSLGLACAAARFPSAPPLSRGIDACAVAIASDARVSHFADASLKSPRRSVELARSPLHVRNAVAPSPFHRTHCGRTFNSSAIFRISAAAATSRSAAAWT
ncbi:hypothetical protein [Streptomyces flavofungini]|uniref:hypothetical protein n=1 Tax=Streptomyces flavofungini TaxID=68200 RepID=UPI0025B143B0|nr:hypothetical protein [Streptomyces flavofungini]WJV47798.1 hypothetical protein QUY26_21130 [Streptomyces flavofungini]